MNIKEDFWDNRYDPPKGLTEEEIKKAEKHLGIKLPTLYCELLKLQNGGSTLGFGFPTQQDNTWAADHVPFYQLSGVDFKELMESKSVLVHSEYYRKEWELVDDVYLLMGEGHWWIVLDYRLKKDEPQISWIESEMDQDFVLAESFQEFIDGLRPEKEFEEEDDEDSIDMSEFTIIED